MTISIRRCTSNAKTPVAYGAVLSLGYSCLSIPRLVPIVGRDAGCDICVADLSETQRSFDHLVVANGHSQYLHGPALNSPVRMRGGVVAA